MKNFSPPAFFLIIFGAFLAGTIWQKTKIELEPKPKIKTVKTIRFQPQQADRPTIELFFQSFNQKDKIIQSNLEKAIHFFGQNITWQPHYFFNQTKTPNEPKACLATQQDNYFCTPLGKQQLNQNIREICAWQLAKSPINWWNFVNLVHQHCFLNKADQCWQAQANQADLPVNQIQNCFSTKAVQILNQEIDILNQKNISQTPQVLINNAKLPTEQKVGQSRVVVKTGDNYFQANEINSQEYFIKAICSAFNQTPEICAK